MVKNLKIDPSNLGDLMVSSILKTLLKQDINIELGNELKFTSGALIIQNQLQVILRYINKQYKQKYWGRNNREEAIVNMISGVCKDIGKILNKEIQDVVKAKEIQDKVKSLNQFWFQDGNTFLIRGFLYCHLVLFVLSFDIQQVTAEILVRNTVFSQVRRLCLQKFPIRSNLIQGMRTTKYVDFDIYPDILSSMIQPSTHQQPRQQIDQQPKQSQQQHAQQKQLTIVVDSQTIKNTQITITQQLDDNKILTIKIEQQTKIQHEQVFVQINEQQSQQNHLQSQNKVQQRIQHSQTSQKNNSLKQSIKGLEQFSQTLEFSTRSFAKKQQDKVKAALIQEAQSEKYASQQILDEPQHQVQVQQKVIIAQKPEQKQKAQTKVVVGQKVLSKAPVSQSSGPKTSMEKIAIKAKQQPTSRAGQQNCKCLIF